MLVRHCLSSDQSLHSNPNTHHFTWRGWGKRFNVKWRAASCEPPTAASKIGAGDRLTVAFLKNAFVVKRLCTWYSLVTQQFAWWFHRIPSNLINVRLFFSSLCEWRGQCFFLLTCSFGIFIENISRKLSFRTLLSVEDWSQKKLVWFCPKESNIFWE